MQFDTELVRAHLQAFDFKSLFNELGWDHYSTTHQIVVDGATITLSAVAHKRGVQIFECGPDSAGKIPEYATRRKVDNQVTRLAHEHLTIFVNSAKTEQIWQWVSKEPEQPARYHEQGYHKGQSGEALLQKLAYLTFPISAEEALTISGVTIRLRDAFQRERVTRRFYERFKDEHTAFLKFLEGIPDEEMERWYVSVMINRLMFIYFVQKKSFLDGDQDYLKHKLAQSKKRGKDLFYRQLLCPLFFEGFAKKESERSVATNRLLGDVPYFNGGLFLKHQIEELHDKKIQIADKAFEKLFEFFDGYQWHLDERPLRDDREINPDVLGYIFEKYINQKQMGAYYSKEDITDYISKNTVLPFLLDTARKQCRVAFEGEQSVWRLLETDPDRYIYKAVRHGITSDINDDRPLPAPLLLPAEIEQGVDTSKPHLLDRRKSWNLSAPAEFALPTETWREVVARRTRYEEVRRKLAAGEVRDVNDLITYNLNIVQFAQDVIENCEGPELLRAFWQAIVGRIPEKSNQKFQQGVSILDPACGSGAFLFAALNILEPLYETCLVRMEAFLGDLERSGEKHRPEKFADFRRVLERVSQHPNRRYFILKSIIVNNLFGVDIMEEAVEICKLRLFLKLVAQVDVAAQIEPLPDIDFNVRAGNTLVGYSTFDDVKGAVTSKLAFDDTMQRIEEGAADIDRLFNHFRQQQTEFGGEVTSKDKKQLGERLKILEDELSGYLAGEYGIRLNDKVGLSKWLKSHKTFHWFIEFHSIMKNGGFDVIIGNPPYVEYTKIITQYTVRGFEAEAAGNLYAFILERCLRLLQNDGLLGLIVPHSVAATYRSNPIQNLLLTKSVGAYSFFSRRPGKLFEGADQCLCIYLGHLNRSRHETRPNLSTTYQRWYTEERATLFSELRFCETNVVSYWKQYRVLPKLGSEIEKAILEKISRDRAIAGSMSESGAEFYCHRISRYFIKATNFVPYFCSERDGVKRSDDFKIYYTEKPTQALLLVAVLNSSLFYWFWRAMFDGYHCGRDNIAAFPFDPKRLRTTLRDELISLTQQLMLDFRKNAERKRVHYRGTGLVEYDEFNVKFSKPIIDEIDRLLAQHYGLTEEELDFIINYDIKYRMSLNANQEGEE